jgi:hypothetical protein
MSEIIAEAKNSDQISSISSPLINAEMLPTLILGGGFTGLFTALHLSHQHYKIPTILIDQDWSCIFITAMMIF